MTRQSGTSPTEEAIARIHARNLVDLDTLALAQEIATRYGFAGTASEIRRLAHALEITDPGREAPLARETTHT